MIHFFQVRTGEDDAGARLDLRKWRSRSGGGSSPSFHIYPQNHYKDVFAWLLVNYWWEHFSTNLSERRRCEKAEIAQQSVYELAHYTNEAPSTKDNLRTHSGEKSSKWHITQMKHILKSVNLTTSELLQVELLKQQRETFIPQWPPPRVTFNFVASAGIAITGTVPNVKLYRNLAKV